MNFTNSPFERMMKEVPWPGRGSDDPCTGCRYYKECKGRKKQCRKKFRALIVEPRPSGHRGPKSLMDARELTRDEKKKIRSLVTGMCANYDRETGLCLPLDCACYMLHKCWTGAYCRYFREAVLPLDPELLAALTVEGGSPELRACTVCGRAFLPEGRQAYCSDACKAEGNRRKSRERMRKMREKRPGGGYDLPPRKA